MRQSGHPAQRRTLAGFSVIEALLTLGLISLVLSILGSLLMTYSRVMLHQGDHQKSIFGCQVAAESIRHDVASAIKVEVVSSDRLRLVQIDRLVTSRLPRPLPDPLDTEWEAHADEFCLEVDYRLLSGSVVRKTSYHSGVSFEEVISPEVDGLRFTKLPNKNLEVVCSAEIRDQVQIWRIEALPQLPQPSTGLPFP